MLLEERTVSFQGKPLFQRAKFKTPFRTSGKLDDMACFFYMIEGTYEAFELHGAVKIGPNEALIKKCGNYVASFQEGKWDGIVIYLYPDVLHEIYKYQTPPFLGKEPQSIPPQKLIGNELLEKFINGLSIYFDNPNLMDEELALLKMKELILILLKSKQYKNIRQFIAELFSPDKLHFTSVVENNIFSTLSIKELAFICHKSLSSFQREFKKIYHDTPSRYIKNKRLERAADLLRATEHTISHIAFEVGFQDATTFSASFREKFKTSPSQYRLNQTRKSLTKTRK